VSLVKFLSQFYGRKKYLAPIGAPTIFGKLVVYKHFAPTGADELPEFKGGHMTLQIPKQETVSKAELYADLQAQLRSLLAGERDFIANAANLS
jgi:hypothetical protein